MTCGFVVEGVCFRPVESVLAIGGIHLAPLPPTCWGPFTSGAADESPGFGFQEARGWSIASLPRLPPHLQHLVAGGAKWLGRGYFATTAKRLVRRGFWRLILLGDGAKPGPRSGGHCYELAELLGWCHPAQRLARTFVELGGDGIELSFGDGGEVEAAG